MYLTRVKNLQNFHFHLNNSLPAKCRTNQPVYEILVVVAYALTHSLNMHVQLSSGVPTLDVQTVKAPSRLPRCAGLPEPSLLAYVLSTKILSAG